MGKGRFHLEQNARNSVIMRCTRRSIVFVHRMADPEPVHPDMIQPGGEVGVPGRDEPTLHARTTHPSA